jgi:ethanolamine kinase
MLSLLRQLLPEWTHVQDVSIEPITGGITNELTLATPTSNPPGSAHPDENKSNKSPSPVVVRVFGNGTDAFLDRGAENRAVRALNAHGFGATCLGVFANGRVEEALVNLRSMTPEEMPTPGGAAAVAGAMRRLHGLVDVAGVEEGRTTRVIDKIAAAYKSTYRVLRDWHRWANEWDFDPAVAKARGTTVEAMRNTRDALVGVSSGISLDELDTQVETCRERLGVSSPYVLLHNDALPGNFMVNKDWRADSGESPREMRTIDFEYACVGPRGFDLANHFIEHAGFECDWSLLPDAKTRARFYAAYSLAGDSDVDIDSLEMEVRLMTPVSHLWWGLWAVMQATRSTIDFDYMGYAAKRLQKFHETAIELNQSFGDSG